MEKDELQILIDESRKNLSPESRQAIDSVNWKLTILEMAGKYNQDQLDTLETETELLLCGILNPEVYQTELENRMMLTKEEVSSLLEEMDKLIFKKIQSELEKILKRQNIKIPEESKDAITNDELRIMNEEVGSKEGRTKITNDELRITSENIEDEVPKPPYAKSMTNDELPITNTEISTQNKNPVQEKKSDVFEDKLKGPMVVSEHTVSDYSKTKDPYREEI